MLGNEGEALKNTLSMFERSRVLSPHRVWALHAGTGEAIRYATNASKWQADRRSSIDLGMLAEMATKVDAARLLTQRAASMIEAGVPARWKRQWPSIRV